MDIPFAVWWRIKEEVSIRTVANNRQIKIHTVKTLFLGRHAKSGHNQGVTSDFDRRLDEEGIRQAKEIGRRLKLQGEIPQQLVSSSAVRALSTARLMADEWGKHPEEVDKRRILYNAGIPEILKVINELGNSSQSAIIFGHNPGLSETLNYLSGTMQSPMSPCTVAKIVFSDADSWKEISMGVGTVDFILAPHVH